MMVVILLATLSLAIFVEGVRLIVQILVLFILLLRSPLSRLARSDTRPKL